jgi:hypothetical protein
MPEVGRLRIRDSELVVEGMAGKILAKVEPDDHMTVGYAASIFDLFNERIGGPRRCVVEWTQEIDEGRGFIDVEAVEVRTEPTAGEIGAGDA